MESPCCLAVKPSAGEDCWTGQSGCPWSFADGNLLFAGSTSLSHGPSIHLWGGCCLRTRTYTYGGAPNPPALVWLDSLSGHCGETSSRLVCRWQGCLVILQLGLSGHCSQNDGAYCRCYLNGSELSSETTPVSTADFLAVQWAWGRIRDTDQSRTGKGLPDHVSCHWVRKTGARHIECLNDMWVPLFSWLPPFLVCQLRSWGWIGALPWWLKRQCTVNTW